MNCFLCKNYRVKHTTWIKYERDCCHDNCLWQWWGRGEGLYCVLQRRIERKGYFLSVCVCVCCVTNCVSYDVFDRFLLTVTTLACSEPCQVNNCLRETLVKMFISTKYDKYNRCYSLSHQHLPCLFLYWAQLLVWPSYYLSDLLLDNTIPLVQTGEIVTTAKNPLLTAGTKALSCFPRYGGISIHKDGHPSTYQLRQA